MQPSPGDSDDGDLPDDRKRCQAPTGMTRLTFNTGGGLVMHPVWSPDGPALRDGGAPAWVAGGAVDTYPAGLAVAYLYKLSLVQHCL